MRNSFIYAHFIFLLITLFTLNYDSGTSVLVKCSLLKKIMFRGGWNTSASWWQEFRNKGCTIDPNFIDDCHRLGKNNDRVIVNFTRRKDCKQILKVKKDLRNLDMEDLDLPRGTKIYINQSLCPYYQIL